MKKIPLRNKKQETKQFTIVDNKYYEYLKEFKWSLDGSGYAQRCIKINNKWTVIRMHRDILGLKGRQMADHMNHNKLDNRISNLRICTPTQNICNRGIHKNNTSGYKGVYYNKKYNVYQVYVGLNYKHKYFGQFNTAIEAARAYDSAVLNIHGEFANLNFKIKTN